MGDIVQLSILLFMHFSKPKRHASDTCDIHPFQAWAIAFGFTVASAVLGAGPVNAQSTQAPVAQAAVSSPSTSPANASPPRYAASDVERAFKFMDANHDDKVSREEASGFRGVARHFDQADTNRDGQLSLEEFGTAMNYVKPQ